MHFHPGSFARVCDWVGRRRRIWSGFEPRNLHNYKCMEPPHSKSWILAIVWVTASMSGAMNLSSSQHLFPRKWLHLSSFSKLLFKLTWRRSWLRHRLVPTVSLSSMAAKIRWLDTLLTIQLPQLAQHFQWLQGLCEQRIHPLRRDLLFQPMLASESTDAGVTQHFVFLETEFSNELVDCNSVINQSVTPKKQRYNEQSWKPELSPPFLTRKAGRPLSAAGLINLSKFSFRTWIQVHGHQWQDNQVL